MGCGWQLWHNPPQNARNGEMRMKGLSGRWTDWAGIKKKQLEDGDGGWGGSSVKEAGIKAGLLLG